MPRPQAWLAILSLLRLPFIRIHHSPLCWRPLLHLICCERQPVFLRGHQSLIAIRWVRSRANSFVKLLRPRWKISTRTILKRLNGWLWALLAVWGFFSKAKGFLSGIDSFYSNSHLVKKIKFPLENIPQITVVQEYFRYLLLIILIFIVLAIYHIYPSLTWFLIIYSSLATILFLNAATKFVSVLSTLVKDIQNIVSAVFNVVFWISGVVFDVETIKNTHKTIYSIIKVNPFEYLISTWRKVFLNKFVVDSNFIKYSIIFWTTTFVVYLLGKITMNKFKGDFADII